VVDETRKKLNLMFRATKIFDGVLGSELLSPAGERLGEDRHPWSVEHQRELGLRGNYRR
jgi:hypothetical protein